MVKILEQAVELLCERAGSMKKYIRASSEKYELSYTIALEFEIVPIISQFKAASTDISDHTPLPTYAEVLDFLANTAPTLIDGSKFVVEKSHGSDTESYYAKLSAIGPEGYIVIEPVARVRFASHVNGDERHNVINNPDVKNITEGYSSVVKGNREVKLIRALLQFDENTKPEDVRLPYIPDLKSRYITCNSLSDAPNAIRKLLDFAYNDLISCKKLCTYRTCTLSKDENDLWQIITSDKRKVESPCDFSKAIKILDRKNIKNSYNMMSDDEILDSIGHDIISRLSSKYPDIEFYLIDVYQIKDTLYFEYNSSVGYHECVALRTDFSKLMDKQYYEQTVTSIYNYIRELFDADDDDSYLFED